MLTVIDAIQNSKENIKLLQCNTCGAKYISKNDSIKECKICNNHTYDMKDVYEDGRKYEKILAKSSLSAFMNDLLSSKKEIYYGNFGVMKRNYWDIIDYLFQYETRLSGNDVPVTKKLVLKCNRCGIIKIVDAYNSNGSDANADNVVCNNCRNKLVAENNNDSDSRWKAMKYYYTREQKKAEEYTELDKQAQAGKKAVEESMQKEKSASYTRKLQKELSIINPSLKILSRYEANNKDLMQIECLSCGSIIKAEGSGKDAFRDITCSGCKAIRNGNFKYVGPLKRNLNGTVKNLYYVKETYDDQVAVICHLCGWESTVNKIEFLNGEIRHNCKYGLDMVCEYCGSPIEVNFNKIFDNEDCECDKCHHTINPLTLNQQILANDKQAEILRALKILGGKTESRIDIKGNIAVVEDSLYVDSNNHSYHNCRCLEHKQNIILEYNSVDTYDHSMCNSEYDMLIPKSAFRKLTMRALRTPKNKENQD